MTEPTYLTITVPHALGHAVIELDDDGRRRVTHADPTVRIPAEVLGRLVTGTFPGVGDNVVFPAEGTGEMNLANYQGGFEVRLDTAGEIRYRPTGLEPGGNVVLVRIGGPDDDQPAPLPLAGLPDGFPL